LHHSLGKALRPLIFDAEEFFASQLAPQGI
jgi:hypothetical protein